jgi:hypothetical protein
LPVRSRLVGSGIGLRPSSGPITQPASVERRGSDSASEASVAACGAGGARRAVLEAGMQARSALLLPPAHAAQQHAS